MDKFKVTVSEYKRDEYGFDMLISQTIITNKGKRFTLRDLTECPEDASFSRDIPNASEVISLMKLAYQAGKDGLKFETKYVKEDE